MMDSRLKASTALAIATAQAGLVGTTVMQALERPGDGRCPIARVPATADTGESRTWRASMGGNCAEPVWTGLAGRAGSPAGTGVLPQRIDVDNADDSTRPTNFFCWPR